MPKNKEIQERHYVKRKRGRVGRVNGGMEPNGDLDVQSLQKLRGEDINCYWPVRMWKMMWKMMLKMTLMHKQREMGRVMRMRSAERQVRTKAHGPGPSGSAENILMIFNP